MVIDSDLLSFPGLSSLKSSPSIWGHGLIRKLGGPYDRQVECFGILGSKSAGAKSKELRCQVMPLCKCGLRVEGTEELRDSGPNITLELSVVDRVNSQSVMKNSALSVWPPYVCGDPHFLGNLGISAFPSVRP